MLHSLQGGWSHENVHHLCFVLESAFPGTCCCGGRKLPWPWTGVWRSAGGSWMRSWVPESDRRPLQPTSFFPRCRREQMHFVLSPLISRPSTASFSSSLRAVCCTCSKEWPQTCVSSMYAAPLEGLGWGMEGSGSLSSGPTALATRDSHRFDHKGCQQSR